MFSLFCFLRSGLGHRARVNVLRSNLGRNAFFVTAAHEPSHANATIFVLATLSTDEIFCSLLCGAKNGWPPHPGRCSHCYPYCSAVSIENDRATPTSRCTHLLQPIWLGRLSGATPRATSWAKEYTPIPLYLKRESYFYFVVIPHVALSRAPRILK